MARIISHSSYCSEISYFNYEMKPYNAACAEDYAKLNIYNDKYFKDNIE